LASPGGISNGVFTRNPDPLEPGSVVGLAKATKDPKISAALLEKAADLKLQVDGPGMLGDLTPLAPDMEPPKA
jgi:hypothetical protein